MNRNLVAAGALAVFLVGGCAAEDHSLPESCDNALVAADRVAAAAKGATSARNELLGAFRNDDPQRITAALETLSREEAVVETETEKYNSLRDQCRADDGFSN